MQMETNFAYIDENYKRIVDAMEEAKAKYRKPSDDITLMAVTKTVAPEAVNHAISCGIHTLGENREQDILIEVNVGGEASKSGIAPDQLEELLHEAGQLSHVHVRGLMTIPPVEGDEKFLYKMQQLYLDISSKKMDNIDMEILSMGMSGDFAAAIRYGSTLVRIGTALFGARNYQK